jgi:hypothetical protein
MDKALEEGRCEVAHGLGSRPGVGHGPNQPGALHERSYLRTPDSRAVLPRINDKNGIKAVGESWLEQAPAFRYHTPGPVPDHRIAILPDCHEDSPVGTGGGGKVMQTHALDGTAGT